MLSIIDHQYLCEIQRLSISAIFYTSTAMVFLNIMKNDLYI